MPFNKIRFKKDGRFLIVLIIFFSYLLLFHHYSTEEKDLVTGAVTGSLVPLDEANATSCGDIRTDLTLTTNISATGTCFIINASDIVIDGAGYVVTGSGSGDGFSITDAFDNVTIKNFGGINNFAKGIFDDNGGLSDSTIFNNSITSDSGVALYSYKAKYNNISNNVIVSNSATNDGIDLSNAGYNTIEFNDITVSGNNQVGIYMVWSLAKFNTVTSNTISVSGKGGRGINFHSSTFSNTATRNTITLTNTGEGIYVTGDGAHFFNSNTITSSDIGVYLRDASLHTFDNDTISATNFDIEIDEGSANLTNVSFDRTNIRFVAAKTGSITVNDYLNVLVRNATVNLANANVTIHNFSGSKLHSELTAADGTISRQLLTSFWINDTSTIHHSPHTINTTLTGYDNDSTTVNLTATGSTLRIIVLGNDSVAPTLSNSVNTSLNFRKHENFTANITIKDALLDYYIFSTNASGSWVNTTRDIYAVEYNASEQANITIAQGNQVCWYYWANDSSGNSANSSTHCFTVQNTLPQAQSVNLTSNDDLNRTNGSLSGVWGYYDLDGDTESDNETQWYNDSVEVVSLRNSTTVLSGNTTKGESWIFSVRLFDGNNWGNRVNSSALTIINIAPTFNESLTAQSANSEQEFIYKINCSDIDGDTITYYDNTSLFNINESTGIINDTPIQSEAGTYDINISCDDGEVNTSQTFAYTINDATDPTFSNATNISLNFRRYENFTANITINDTALDYYIFSTNASGLWENTTRDISGAEHNASEQANITLAQGNQVCWYYWANDSSGNSANSSTYCFTVVNTAPAFNQSLTNQAINSGEEFTYKINCSDIDGDTITYYDNTSLFDINESTGIINDTPAANEVGAYIINVTCGDGEENVSEVFTYTVGDGTVPNASLISPDDGYSNNSAALINISFVCNSTDNYLLKNISLYITNSSNQSFVLNQTTNISGTSNQSNWSLMLGVGTYTWNCLIYDDNSNSAWGENRSLVLNYVAPDSTSSTSGGGGGGTSVKECVSDLDCAANQYCNRNNRCVNYTCMTDADCEDDEYCLDHQCVELFDLKIIKVDSPIEPGDFLDFNYLIKAMANISGDVNLEFWLEKDDEIITSGSDVIFIGNFEEKIESTNLFLPTETEEGNYNLHIKLTYGKYKITSSRLIEIKEEVPLVLGLEIIEFPTVVEGKVVNYSAILSSNKDDLISVLIEQEITDGQGPVWFNKKTVILNRSLVLSSQIPDLLAGQYQLELMAIAGNVSAEAMETFTVLLLSQRNLFGKAVAKITTVIKDYSSYWIMFVLVLIISLCSYMVIRFLRKRKKHKK